jgi:hypothetical protein
LRPAELITLDDWLRPYRDLWNTSLDALQQHLDSQEDNQGGQR